MSDKETDVQIEYFSPLYRVSPTTRVIVSFHPWYKDLGFYFKVVPNHPDDLRPDYYDKYGYDDAGWNIYDVDFLGVYRNLSDNLYYYNRILMTKQQETCWRIIRFCVRDELDFNSSYTPYVQQHFGIVEKVDGHFIIQYVWRDETKLKALKQFFGKLMQIVSDIDSDKYKIILNGLKQYRKNAVFDSMLAKVEEIAGSSLGSND